ncbi:MAG: oxaloacetate-decarboxylating malate dehydrogenase [Anaerolineaceae bacterium]|nr:oxaloacetate-decarboxylating malate dehydrogenase [Anaerolineaceae bacterium]
MIIDKDPIQDKLHVDGLDLLRKPSLNRSMAFTAQERRDYKLRGLLPPRVRTIEEQAKNVLANFHHKNTNLEKYVYLMDLQSRNHTLFYYTLMRNLPEMMPIVYTPTVGLACQEYSEVYVSGRGLFISEDDCGEFDQVLANWPEDDVRVIVVTDGERILGLGDLGANGMGIPIGKLALYTSCAGINPRQCLPITIDVGTENSHLLEDPKYIGLSKHRTRGEKYDAIIDEFITVAQRRFPKAVIQFEDFGNQNAFRLLEKYRHQYRVFNDDIQGTAGVTLAGALSALRITGQRLSEQTILFLGAGEAGIGIGNLIASAMVSEGLSLEQARQRCWFVDSKGLVVAGRSDLAEHKRAFAHKHEFVADLLSAVEALRPTMLIGASGMPNTFTQPIVEAMARFNQRPVIFALSNPTSKSECTAEEAYRWSDGRAIFASGSPFPPVTLDEVTYNPGQANNSYIFPGVGLGIVISGARHITDSMFTAAARALVEQVSEDDLKSGQIYPPLATIRAVSANIAEAVANIAYDEGLAENPKPQSLTTYIQSQMYDPQ